MTMGLRRRGLATRKAYIYMLEILAQLVAFVTFGAKLPTAVIAFIDNTAGQAALTKVTARTTRSTA